MREHAAAADPARFAIRTATCSAEAYDKFRADVGRHHPSLRSLRSIRTHAHAALRAAAAVAVYAVCAAAVYAAARRRARPAVCAAAAKSFSTGARLDGHRRGHHGSTCSSEPFVL